MSLEFYISVRFIGYLKGIKELPVFVDNFVDNVDSWCVLIGNGEKTPEFVGFFYFFFFIHTKL